jgi:hypothetical protein
MQALLSTPTFWLRASLLSVSGLVLASVIASVFVSLRQAHEPPAAPAGSAFQMDEASFRQAIGVDRLYEGVEWPAEPPSSR